MQPSRVESQAKSQKGGRERVTLSAARSCEGCGVEFVPARKDQRFHDRQCRLAAYKASEHACPICGLVHRAKV